MLRLLFTKTGRSVWISHLDLMRLFQRAFKRAALPLTHTQGYNPRPSVSIALPLSVGVESRCELLDFELDGAEVACDEIRDRLNACLVEGVEVLAVYSDGRKLRDLSLLRCDITLEYDAGVPQNCAENLQKLFDSVNLDVPKKTKNGMQNQNIIPMIREISFMQTTDREVAVSCVICCQNPTLNPMQIPAAISIHAPELAPNFSRCVRLEIFDNSMQIFR